MQFEVPAPLIPIALFYFICAIVSFFGNMTMIICFFRVRKFQSPCHYMITLTCAADMLHLCGHFVFNYQLFYGGPASQELCFWLLLPSCIGLCLSGPLLLSMGIDRFLACQCPIIYRQLCAKSSTYIILLLLFPVLYTVYFMTHSFLGRDPDTILICQVPLAFSVDSFEKFNKGGLMINVGVVLIYFVTFLKLKYKPGNGSEMKFIFKSILYTVIFVILGWCTVTIVNIASIRFVENIDVQHIIMIYAGIGLNVACASNVFVFYRIK